MVLIGTTLIVGGLFFLAGIRIVRPTQRALVERLGKYKRFANAGFHWIIPIIDRMYKVNITEQMVDAARQEVITKDNLNATVDAVIYFKVKDSEADVKNTTYNVDNLNDQIVSLARTTLRNIIGTLTLTQANSERSKINDKLQVILQKETKEWGINVVRAELKEIEPPGDVQKAMNEVVVAENKKIAAKDYAEAKEIEADGDRRAEIKRAEGKKQAIELEAGGRAQAIKDINESAQKYFIGNAQVLRKIEAVEASLKHNAKVVLPKDEQLVNVIGNMAGVAPVPIAKSRKQVKK